jgi:hypothetical protein
MSLTYNSFITSLSNMLVVPSTDANFLTAIPNIIDDNEGRIYRDLDFLATISSTLISGSTTSRTITLSTAQNWQVVESMNVVYATTSGADMKAPLPQVARDYLDIVYPQTTAASSTTRPTCYAMLTNLTFLLGPACGASSMSIEVIGTIRPAALDSTNTETYLTQNYSELFLAGACMFGAAYLKNFGAVTDDPKSGMTWEAHYRSLLDGIVTEEQRRKTQGLSVTSKEPKG